MKKFWKTLGLTALAATLIPYRIEGDKETGALTVQALLWKLTEKTDANGTKNVSIKFLSFGADEEDGLFTDDPEEAVLFADHEPEAAVIQHEANVAEHEAAVAEHEAAVAEHEAAVAEHEAAVAEHEAAVAEHEAASAEEEAGEADFDPEL